MRGKSPASEHVRVKHSKTNILLSIRLSLADINKRGNIIVFLFKIGIYSFVTVQGNLNPPTMYHLTSRSSSSSTCDNPVSAIVTGNVCFYTFR